MRIGIYSIRARLRTFEPVPTDKKILRSERIIFANNLLVDVISKRRFRLNEITYLLYRWNIPWNYLGVLSHNCHFSTRVEFFCRIYRSMYYGISIRCSTFVFFYRIISTQSGTQGGKIIDVFATFSTETRVLESRIYLTDEKVVPLYFFTLITTKKLSKCYHDNQPN